MRRHVKIERGMQSAQNATLPRTQTQLPPPPPTASASLASLFTPDPAPDQIATDACEHEALIPNVGGIYRFRMLDKEDIYGSVLSCSMTSNGEPVVVEVTLVNPFSGQELLNSTTRLVWRSIAYFDEVTTQ